MQRASLYFWLIPCLALPAGCPEEAGGACDNDQDCKGERLCIEGECQDPDGTNGGPTSEGDPTGSASSTSEGTTEPGTTFSSSSADETSTGSFEQPYGVCRFECSTTADCCNEFSCEFGTTWTCEEGLCRSQCVPANCDEAAGVQFGCVVPTVDIPGSSSCAVTCDNACSDVNPDPAFYCNQDAGYEPDVCILDCRQAQDFMCSGSSGVACLPNGNCGCFDQGDCAPGHTCFKGWE